MAMSNDELIESLRARVASTEGARRGVATADALTTAEATLGFDLPRSLREVLARVENGGFGPAFGLYGVGAPASTGRACDERSIESCFVEFAAHPTWPRRLLPICDWGCAIWSCVDRESDLIVTSSNGAFASTGRSFFKWLEGWLDGVDLHAEMFGRGPDRAGINPFTKKPMTFRGAGPLLGERWP
jgi:hypothetical protein